MGSLHAPTLLIAIGLVVHLSTHAAAESAEEQFQLAAGYYRQQDWQLAADAFYSLLADHPQDGRVADTRFYLAETLVQLEQFDQAAKQFSAFLLLHPNGQRAARALFRQGECAFLSDKPVGAGRALDEFRQLYPNHPLNAYALPYLAELALQSGDRPWARKLYSEALDQFPQGPMVDVVQLQLGLIYYYDGEFEQARQVFQEFRKQFEESPQLPTALYWLGLTQLASKSFEDAAETLQQVASEHPDHELAAASTYYAGEAYRRGGELNKAANLYAQATQQWPGSDWGDDCLLGQMRLALAAEEWDHVVSLHDDLQRDFAGSPRRDEAARLTARALLKLQRYGEAAALLEPLVDTTVPLKSRPQRVAWNTNLYLLSLARIGQNRFDDALGRIGQIRPDDLPPTMVDGVSMARATALLGLEDYAAALPSLQEYLRSKPEGSEADACRAKLVVALCKTGDVARAERVYRQLPNRNNAEAQVMAATRHLAEALYARGNKAGARELFLLLSNEYVTPQEGAQGHSGLAWLQLQEGEFEDAIDTFVRLCELFPDDPAVPQARLAYAQALRKVGRTDEAIRAYTVVSKEHADTPQAEDALLEMAELLHQGKQYEQAAETLERLLSEYPDHKRKDAALYLWAWTRADQGNEEEATSLFLRLMREFPSSRFWSDAAYRVADQAAEQGDYEQANRTLDRLIRADVDRSVMPHALYLKGQIAGQTAKWQDVAGPLNRLLEEFPQSPLAYPARYWIAEAFYQQGEYDEAIEQFEQLDEEYVEDAERRPWTAMIRLRRAQLQAARGEWLVAQRLAATIPDQFPNFSQQYEVDYLMGRCFAARGEFTNARTHYQAVTNSAAAQPTEVAVMAQWMIGETYFHQKKYDQAIEEYLRAEQNYDAPRWQAAALLEAGKCYEKKGDRTRASELYSQLIRRFPQTPFTTEATSRLREANR